MSVMLLEKDYFQRIGKYFSLNKGKEEASNLCLAWHELNYRNFCKRYERHGEEFKGHLFTKECLDLLYVPIPSVIQVVSDMSRLLYNSIDYGEELMPDALHSLKNEIEELKKSKMYQLEKKFNDHAKF